MAQTDALKPYLDAGMAFTQLTRDRAQQIVKDLVAAGELQQKQTKQAIEDLIERSRKNAEAVGELIRAEVTSQLTALGLATQADIERLEGRIAAVASAKPSTATTAPAPKAPVVKKAPVATPATAVPVAKTAPAKKAPAKKA